MYNVNFSEISNIGTVRHISVKAKAFTSAAGVTNGFKLWCLHSTFMSVWCTATISSLKSHDYNQLRPTIT